MAGDASLSSDSLRERGNELYKAGQITKAIEYYKQSAAEDASSHKPYGNLSAAYFEVGHYAAAIEACDAALARIPQDQDAARQKLNLRKAKCHLHEMQIDKASSTCEKLAESEETRELQKTISQYRNGARHTSELANARKQLILQLPRYKPTLMNVPDYYVIGHDDPESLYDSSLLPSQRNTISLLFGGIGDARNLLQTIAEIAVEVEQGSVPIDKRFHFTIVDLKAPAIARNFIVFLMLDEMADMIEDTKRLRESRLVPCLYLTYLSAIMPDGLYQILQSKIQKAIDILEGNAQMPKVVDIPSMFRDEVLTYLRQWRDKAQSVFPVVRVCQQITKTRRTESETTQFGSMAQGSGGCFKEKIFHDLTGGLILPPPHHDLMGIDLVRSYNAFDPRKAEGEPTGLIESMRSIRGNWKTNVTFIDLPWERQYQGEEGRGIDVDVSSDPFYFMRSMDKIGCRPENPKCLFDWAVPWLLNVAGAFKVLRNRIKIEGCVGELSALLEQIRYGVVGHRSQTVHAVTAGMQNTSLEPNDEHNSYAEYPRFYDRMHLSNVPDYIGGTLATYLYALPITHVGANSYVTSTCLRNPPRFKAAGHFNAEYVALHAPVDLAKAFHARMQPTNDPDMPMCAYNKWYHRAQSTAFHDLLPRAKLETWLYRFFFRIAIPKHRAMEAYQMIYSPLNLTAFLRLCAHLHVVGYPAHWIAGALSNILSGKVNTDARPPRSEPLKIREIETEMSLMQQSTQPFVAELSTLVSMSHLVLPFGLVSSSVAPLDSIHQFSVAFETVSRDAPMMPSFVLAIYRGDLLEPRVFGLYHHLLSDEMGLKSKDAKELRERGLHIISTWMYERKSQTGTFRLRRDVVEELKKSSAWRVSIFRSDNWMPASEPVSVQKLQDTGVNWTSQLDS